MALQGQVMPNQPSQSGYSSAVTRQQQGDPAVAGAGQGANIQSFGGGGSFAQKVASGNPAAVAAYDASPQGQEWQNSNTNKFLQSAGLDYNSQMAANRGAGNPQAQAAVQQAFGQLSPQQQWQLAGTGQGSNAGYGTGMFGGFLGNNGNQLASYINSNAYSNTPGSQGYGSFAGAKTPGPSGTIGYSGTPYNPGGPGRGQSTGQVTSYPASPYSGSGTASNATAQMNPGQGIWDPSVKATYDPGQTGDYLGSYGGQYYGQGNVPSAANNWGQGISGAPAGSQPSSSGAYQNSIQQAANSANPSGALATSGMGMNEQTGQVYGGTSSLPAPMFGSAAQQASQNYANSGGTIFPGYSSTQPISATNIPGNMVNTNLPQTMGIGNYINTQRAAPSYFPQTTQPAPVSPLTRR